MNVELISFNEIEADLNKIVFSLEPDCGECLAGCCGSRTGTCGSCNSGGCVGADN